MDYIFSNAKGRSLSLFHQCKAWSSADRRHTRSESALVVGGQLLFRNIYLCPMYFYPNLLEAGFHAGSQCGPRLGVANAKKVELAPFSVIQDLIFWYKLYITLKIFPLISFRSNLFHSAILQTLSKALEKSTKAQNSFFFCFLRSSNSECSTKIGLLNNAYGNQPGFLRGFDFQS